VDTGTRPRTAGRPNLIVLPQGRSLRLAFTLSVGALVASAAAAAIGLLHPGVYTDEPWVREALRGGDLITLTLAVPVFAAALIASARGSRRARPAWIGALGYAAYCNTYRVFGTEFNDVFPLHIAALSMSLFAIAAAVPNLDLGAIAEPIRSSPLARWVAAFLVVVGVVQAWQWIGVLVRFARGDGLMDQVPLGAQHLVCGLDLAVLVPTVVIAGVLMFRRTTIGAVLGTAVCVMVALHQASLLAAGAFQTDAGIAGAQAFPLERIFLTVMFAAASLALLSAPDGVAHVDGQASARRTG
jgi:hypothetical protein